MIQLAYVDKLQRQNADDLAFYPLTTLAKAIEERHVIACEDNGDPAGYLWFGALRGGYDVTIYQACVDYDSRRRLGGGVPLHTCSAGRHQAWTRPELLPDRPPTGAVRSSGCGSV